MRQECSRGKRGPRDVWSGVRALTQATLCVTSKSVKGFRSCSSLRSHRPLRGASSPHSSPKGARLGNPRPLRLHQPSQGGATSPQTPPREEPCPFRHTPGWGPVPRDIPQSGALSPQTSREGGAMSLQTFSQVGPCPLRHPPQIGPCPLRSLGPSRPLSAYPPVLSPDQGGEHV